MGAGSWTGALPNKTGSAFRKTRKFIKQTTSRKSRRLGKKLGQDAPTKIISGWSD